MAFIWTCSMTVKRDEILFDPEIMIDDTIKDEKTIEDHVHLKGQKGSGAVLEYFYDDEEKVWILSSIGYHSCAVPVLRHLNQTYGENYMELDEDYEHYFDINFNEEKEVDPEDLNLFINLWRMSYMDMYELLGDDDPFTEKMKNIDRLKLVEWLTSMPEVPDMIIKGVNNVILGGKRKEYID